MLRINQKDREQSNSLFRFHHRFIVVAQISNWAFLTARALKHADPLPVAQQSFVEVVDCSGVLGQ